MVIKAEKEIVTFDISLLKQYLKTHLISCFCICFRRGNLKKYSILYKILCLSFDIVKLKAHVILILKYLWSWLLKSMWSLLLNPSDFVSYVPVILVVKSCDLYHQIPVILSWFSNLVDLGCIRMWSLFSNPWNLGC